MAMFCTKCGTPNAEGSVFCGGCGATLQAAPAPQPAPQPVYQAPQQPVYQAPQQPVFQAPQQPAYQAPAQPASQAPSKVSAALKKNLNTVVALVLIISLISGAMHLFGWYHQEVGFSLDIPQEMIYDAPASAVAGLMMLQNMDGKIFIAMSMADVRDMVDSMVQTMEMGGMDITDPDALEEAEESVPGIKDCVTKITMFGISSYVLGGTGAAVALLALYLLLQLKKNAPGTRKLFTITAVVAFLGAAAALVLAILGSNPGIEAEGVKLGLILNIHVTYFLSAAAGLVLLYADRVALKGDNTVLR